MLRLIYRIDPCLAGVPEDLDEDGGDEDAHGLEKVSKNVNEGGSNIYVLS